MFRKALFAAILGLAALSPRAFPQATIPSMPAGQTLQAWLTAFNSGDRTQMDAYVHKYDPKGSADRVKDAHPAEITELGLQALPPDANLSEMTFEIDAAARAA